MKRHLWLALALASCTDDLATTTTGALTDDEAQKYAADMAFFRARRDAYLRYGTIPTVPPSLSSDPRDPEYVFRGYMHVATADEERLDDAKVAAAWPPAASDAEVASYSLTIEQEAAAGPIGLFVNDVGETWAYRPVNLGARLAALRASRGNVNLRATNSASGGRDAFGQTTQGLGILGADNRGLRSALSGHDMTDYPWRVFGPLVPNGQSTSQVPDVRCSAAKIGERYALTAAHCVFTAGGGTDSVKTRDWWPGGDGLAKSLLGATAAPKGRKNISWYYTSTHFVDDGWWSRDYAVLVLYDNSSSCSLGSLGYRVDNSLAGQDTFNFGYPGNTEGCAGSPDPGGDCGGSMWGGSGHITRTEVPYIFHTHDTQGGQSGSPVYDYNGGNRQIVGIHHGTYSGVENRGVKIRDLVFDFIDSVRDDQPPSACHY